MKLYAPKYYEDFKCIADKCTHSCCIGWEIDVDKEAMKKYSKLKNGYGREIKNSIENGEAPHFKLQENGRCPHFSENGLCKIIINCGEKYLCDICREHPRFYNYTNYGYEVGIGMSCPEACRIILNSDSYNDFEVIARGPGNIERIDYDSLIDREKIFTILKNENLSYENKLNVIYSEYEIDLNFVDKASYLDCINNLEYLNNSHRTLFSAFSLESKASEEKEKYLERALAYFVYRHCTEAVDYDEFKISLSFCLFCEKLLASLISDKTEPDVCELARILSEEIEYNTDNVEKIKELFIDYEIL
ncbi:MAG: flagellin lysine-N-methylase [Clostridia bacterium]|nr:flagellin lysine-N-methylase [Clostridia bacterium]